MNSLRDSLLAVAGMPFAAGGGILALYFSGLDFSISAAVGFVSLFGVSVMNGILIMTYFHEVRTSSMSAVDAMFRAAEQRMRSMLTTALSACIGLLPAAISTGIGSQVQRPLAIVVVGGMLMLAADLHKTFPLDTLVQRYWLPTIRAAVALERKDPKRAVELLKMASTIELGQPTSFTVDLCPVYLRGQAYLMLHDGHAAAAEFQKFIDHRGLVEIFPWGALARLGLARAYALDAAKDPTASDKARREYQDFLTLWKDADPDIPILKQAKAEYAELK